MVINHFINSFILTGFFVVLTLYLVVTGMKIYAMVSFKLKHGYWENEEE